MREIKENARSATVLQRNEREPTTEAAAHNE
jgi:hypothetical protein